VPEKNDNQMKLNDQTQIDESRQGAQQATSRKVTFSRVLKVILILLGIIFVTLTIVVTVTELPEPQIPEALLEFIAIHNENPSPSPLPFSTDWILLTYDEIPDTLKKAVVAVEDKRFYSHNGIELVSIMRALFTNLRAGKVVEGGSTITQQLAKNLFLTPERTVERKLKEAVYSLKLEMRCSKKEILEMYLNVIYFGHGTYGCEMASMFYFGKSAKDLDLAEAALLAGIIKGPEIYSPYHNLDLADKRRTLVLDLMVQQGYIDQHLADQAKSEPIEVVSRLESDLASAKLTKR
jgi:membrane peptidoglycan carboxypeptidase